MVVAGRNPAGVLYGQRLPCHSVFSHPAFHRLTTRPFVPNPIQSPDLFFFFFYVLVSILLSWDHNLSNLAKLAFTTLYHQTNRDNEAVSLYNKLAAKPSTTVSTGVAQLALASLYVFEGKTDMARNLWAKVKDADKDGAAGRIAEQKLAAK